jgi:hypothetical protein
VVACVHSKSALWTTLLALCVAFIMVFPAHLYVRAAPAPLSPLQVYLYSRGASVAFVTLTAEPMAGASSAASQGGSIRSAQGDVSTRSSPVDRVRGSLSTHYRVIAQAAHDSEDGAGDVCSVHEATAAAAAAAEEMPSSSSSSAAAAATNGVSLAASFTGRYVVLSRTVSAAPPVTLSSRRLDRPFPAFVHREDDLDNTSRPVGTTPLSLSTAVSQKEGQVTKRLAEGVTRSSSPPLQQLSSPVSPTASSSSPSCARGSCSLPQKPRVFPEEALRDLMQRTQLFSTATPSRPAELQASPLDVSFTAAAAVAPMDERLSGQPPQSPPSQQQQQRSQSFASRASTCDVEVHVIDAAHILVYLPPSEDSVALLRAMAVDTRNDDGAVWRVCDAFSSAEGGPQLKISPTLLRLVGGGGLSEAMDGNVVSSWFSSSSAVTGGGPEVTLWTAQGHAAAVHAAITSSARLRRYLASREATSSLSPDAPSAGGGADPACRLVMQEVNPRASAVRVRVELSTRTTQQPGAEAVDRKNGAEMPGGFLLRPNTSSEATQVQPHTALRELLHCFREVLFTLAAHPAVRWLEESYRRPELLNNVATRTIQQGYCSTYSVNTDAFVKDNTETTRHTPLWDLGCNGSGEIIAIADSGVDTTSCYFHDPAEPIAYYPQLNYRHRKIVSYQAHVDASDGSVDATDKPAGHGTHVAGIAGGCALPSTIEGLSDGASTYNGVAPGAKLFVRDMNGGANAYLSLPSDLLEIFSTAYDAGARISSNSWGFRASSSPFYLAMEKMFDTTVAQRRDLLVLAAVGNSGKNQLYVPGRAKNVLTVGSHLNSPGAALQNTVPEKSAYGVTYDQRRKPDLVAPGGGIHDTVRSTVLSARAVLTPSCATTTHHGTSMATAAVAGAAAIVRQYLREHWGFADPSSALLRAALLHSTTVIPVEPLRRGFGRLDLSRLLPHANHTVDKALPPQGHWFMDDAVVHDNEVRQYCFTLADLPSRSEMQRSKNNSCSQAASLTVTATLVWNDPGTVVEGSVRSQVHDLDLMLVTLHGHTFFSGANGVVRERFNTVEQVRVPISFAIHDNGNHDGGNSAGANTSSTEWMHGFRVLVRGAVVRSAAGQTFALAVSGPGLKVVQNCPTLFDQWRAALTEARSATPSSTATASGNTPSASSGQDLAFCPQNCTVHGTCGGDTLLCHCEPYYTSIDCAECNAEVLCHGHGTCDAQTMSCQCDPRGHFADAHCSTCEDGWYGPDCASNCTCQHGGVCDTVTGLCTCVQDMSLRREGKGCFQGPQCQYCCDGFGGPACNQRSYWCNTSSEVVVVDDAGGGFIQINDFGTYRYSLKCRWSIRAGPDQRVQLKVLSYDIEQYDALYIYDVAPYTASAAAAAAATATTAASWGTTQRTLLRRLTNAMAEPLPPITSTAGQMDLEFVSDWDGTSKGFVLYYRFVSCGEKCRLTNLTGPVGHWQCGVAFGLPTKQCLCAPPYVGWHCNEDSSDIGVLNRELSAMQLEPTQAWQSGELAWMLPRSVFTAAEARLPALLSVGKDASLQLRAAWAKWRSSTTSNATPLVVPVSGTARLPLIVHGFSELQLPLLTLPVRAVMRYPTSASAVPVGHAGVSDMAGDGQHLLRAQLRLRVQLLVEAGWLKSHATELELTLGVSSATERADVTTSSSVNNSSVLSHVNEERGAAGTARVRYDDTAAALALNAFWFTPMTLLRLFECVNTAVVEVAVPLNLLTNVSAAAETMGKGDRRGNVESVEESHWTTRVIFTLLWKDVAGLQVPNVSVVDAVVSAHEVVVMRDVPSATVTTGEVPTADSTVRETAVAVSCNASPRVPVRISEKIVETATASMTHSKKLSSVVRFLALFCALCMGVVGGVMWALRAPERLRHTYVAVQTTDDGQDIPMTEKRG